MNLEIEKKNHNEEQNPYLLLGFWEFSIMSTLMVAFFPWSLLFCVIFYGFEETKFIVAALVHDAIKTILAILSVVVSLIVLILGLIFLFAG